MFVDASAMVAIMAQEPERDAFITAIAGVPVGQRMTSVIAVWEAIAGLARRTSIPVSVAKTDILDFLDVSSIEVVPLTLDHLAPALDAFDRYGRHRLPESDRNRALNLGDCFHYAVARKAGTSILHKDVGLSLTDIPSASS